MEQIILHDSEQQIQIMDDLEQKRRELMNNLVNGFLSRCKTEVLGFSVSDRKTNFNYKGGYFVWRKELIRPSEFSFRGVTSQAITAYSMNRMPFGNRNKPHEELKLNRVAKILILLWYLALIKNIDPIFNADKNSSITNNTNEANFGFSKKVFENKISVFIDEDDYLWEIKIGDFLQTEDRIRQLLKEYLFEKTKYGREICSITQEELDLIQLHC